MAKVCKRHVNNPVMIYHQCVGCELEWFREELEQKQQEIKRLEQEREKLIEGLREVVKFDYHTNPDIHYIRLACEILKEIGVAIDYRSGRCEM